MYYAKVICNESMCQKAILLIYVLLLSAGCANMTKEIVHSQEILTISLNKSNGESENVFIVPKNGVMALSLVIEDNAGASRTFCERVRAVTEHMTFVVHRNVTSAWLVRVRHSTIQSRSTSASGFRRAAIRPLPFGLGGRRRKIRRRLDLDTFRSSRLGRTIAVRVTFARLRITIRDDRGRKRPER